MTIGQTANARFKTIPNLLKSKSTADEETYEPMPPDGFCSIGERKPSADG